MPLGPADLPAQEETAGEDHLATFAQSLQRGRGEVDLVRRLEAQPETPAMQGAGLLRTATIKSTQRVKTAKRLGLGRGEVDLAVRLRRLADQPQHEESTL